MSNEEKIKEDEYRTMKGFIKGEESSQERFVKRLIGYVEDPNVDISEYEYLRLIVELRKIEVIEGGLEDIHNAIVNAFGSPHAIRD